VRKGRVSIGQPGRPASGRRLAPDGSARPTSRIDAAEKSIADAEAVMGFASAKSIAWEAEVAPRPGRHHLRVAVDTEARFWAVYDAGTGADAAACGWGWPVDRVSAVRPAVGGQAAETH